MDPMRKYGEARTCSGVIHPGRANCSAANQRDHRVCYRGVHTCRTASLGGLPMTRRRVVTGVDAEGRSIIVSNGPSSGRFGDSGWEEIWAFDSLPARLDDDVDPVDVPTFRLIPEKGRIAVRIVTFRTPDDPQRIEAERAP